MATELAAVWVQKWETPSETPSAPTLEAGLVDGTAPASDARLVWRTGSVTVGAWWGSLLGRRLGKTLVKRWAPVWESNSASQLVHESALQSAPVSAPLLDAQLACATG